MEPVQTPSAEPAQPSAPAPTTISAEHAAADRRDFSAFDKAFTAARTGKPLPDVSVEAAAPAPSEPPQDPAAPAPPPQLTRKERDQQEANERVRRAVDHATADLRAEIDRLRQAAPPATPPAPAVHDDPEPDPSDLTKYPGGEYDPKYIRAASAWDHRQFDREQRVQSQKAEHESHRQQFLADRSEKMHAAIAAECVADPDLGAKVPPAMLRNDVTTVPLSALTPEQFRSAKFSNLVAEACLHSDRPADLLRHLHAHQDETTAIAQLPTMEYQLAALARLDGRLSAGAAPVNATNQPSKPEPVSTISHAPPPPKTLTGTGSTADPEASAIARRNFSAYDKAFMQKQRAKLTRA